MRLFPTRRARHFSTLLAVVIAMFALAACGVPGVVPQGHSLAATSPTPTAAPLPPVRLPQDEAPHTDLTEWWYYTGHFQGTDASGQAHQYGFELTFFQVSRGNIPTVYVGHYAVSDLTRGQYHFDQRLITTANAVAPNGAAASGFNLAINNWTMKGLNGHDQLDASMQDYTLQLTLDSQQPIALHNGNGIITYGLGGFSYYYSRPSMSISGNIQDHGTTIPVTGQGWMDHQWGNFLTAAGTGWDWYSIQLDNGMEYMVYFIRDASGKTISVVGSQIDAQGQTTEVPASQIGAQVSDHWTSPATQVVYPSGWVLSLPGGSLTITPQLRDQEFNAKLSTGNTYWEGACAITGTLFGQAVTGHGYTELTGYQPAK